MIQLIGERVNFDYRQKYTYPPLVHEIFKPPIDRQKVLITQPPNDAMEGGLHNYGLFAIHSRLIITNNYLDILGVRPSRCRK